ncbi:hypothetical protein ACJJTC_008854 [Scirpophaga incertulas]
MNLFVKLLLISVQLGSLARVVTSRRARLSLAEPPPSYYYTNINGYPGTYAFGYDTIDPNTGNRQFRNEERYPNGTVTGNYGYVDASGKTHSYQYIADKKGYRVTNILSKKSVGATPVRDTPGIESSVTWSKADKNKKIPSKDYLIKLDIKKGNQIRTNNALFPPSYYAVDE